MTPSALQSKAADTDKKTDELLEQIDELQQLQDVVENEPITKLEIDKSRRKLTFADCEPGEEIDAVMAEKEDYDANMNNDPIVESLLERVLVPSLISNKIDGKET